MSRYIRHGTATMEEIIPAILENWVAPSHLKKRLSLQGYKMGVGSLRLLTFARAYRDHGCVKCASCGLQASFFSIDSFPSTSQIPSVHLNLFAVKQTPEGPKDVLFTHDHILARGLGGLDNMDNTQPMCAPCNSAKGGREGKLVEKLRKEKEEALKASLDQSQKLL